MVMKAVPTVLHDWKHASAAEAKREILEAAGDLTDIEIFGAQLLIAPYIRPEKTRGGIITPGSAAREDEFQGKVGLVLKVGPTAFRKTTFKDDGGVDRMGDEAQFGGRHPEVGDWIFHDVKACFQMHIRGKGGKSGIAARLVYAADIFGRLQDLTPVV